MIRVLVAIAALACVLGCSRSSNDRFIPAAPLAQDALKAALDSWVRGDNAAKLDQGSPKIQLADSHRDGTKLASYEILGEISLEGGRRFDVLLKFAEPAKTEKTQYVVVGIDPLWVIRHEDYDMITHWDHPIPAKAPPAEKQKQPSDKEEPQGDSGGQANE
jgi:hypothetical protein